MSRRTRTAALLSTAALLVGGSFSLALAPAASALAPGDPQLGSLSYSPQNPEVGDNLVVSGDGCVGLNPVPTTSAASPAGDTAAPAAQDPLLGSISVTVRGPQGFNSTVEVETNQSGAWTTNSGSDPIQIQNAGDYTITATCQLAGIGIYDYEPATFTVEEPTQPPTADPAVNVLPGSVKPGGTVSVTGVNFGDSTSVSVSLPGYDSQSAPVTNGGWSGVSFLISSTQPAGTLTGTVTSSGGASAGAAPTAVAPVQFTVTVVSDTSVDGPVPSGSPTPSSSAGAGTGSDDDSSGYGYGSGYGYSAPKPTLPNTGTDSLWPGVIGGALLLAGGGLVWAGRRREQTEAPAPTV